MLDSTGIKVSGEGEWKVKIHGKSKRRKWIKVDIAVDAKTQEILQLEIIDSHTADRTVGPRLIRRCPSESQALLGRWGIRYQRLQKSHQRAGSSGTNPTKEKC